MFPGRPFALLLVCVAWAARLAAQPSGELFGRILDPSDAGIPDASVSVIHEETGFRRTTVSEPGGTYAVRSLEPGSYKVTVRKEGFRTMIRFGVRVPPGGFARSDFALSVGSIEESITVTAAAPLLGLDETSVGGHFDRQQLSRLPQSGRGLLTALELVPGTNVVPATRGEAGQFTVSGQRPNANYFTVDGVSANTGVSAGGLPAQSTGGALPSLSAFGSLDSVISLDATQDFEVQTSSTAAEFGRLPGATVAITSQSGTNELHGSLALRARHELLSANNWFANQAGYARQALRAGDVSATAGGPLRRNRAFLFLSYERMHLTQPYVWRQGVPTLEARQNVALWAAPAASLFPAPNRGSLAGGLGEWVGQNRRPARLNAGSARLDQAITSRWAAFARYSDAPSSNEFGSLQANRLDLRAQSLTLGLNARPGGRTVIDVRANETQSSAHSVWLLADPTGTSACGLASFGPEFLAGANACDYLVRLSIGGAGQLLSGREGDRRQRQFQLVQAVTFTGNSHTVKAGADIRRITAIRRDFSGTLGVIADKVADLSDSRNVWVARADRINRSTRVDEFSLWAQDAWRVTNRLSLSAGLRWEYSPAPNPGSPAYFLDEELHSVRLLDRPLWPRRYRNFAPRLGLSFRFDESGRTVLRAGGGLYYDSSLSIATDVINGGPLGISQFGSSGSAPFSSLLSFGFMPDLHLPEVSQWNVTLERSLGQYDAASLSYVGSGGYGLIRREAGGEGNKPTALVVLTTNHGDSRYHALQAQYRRHTASGWNVLASYTWSHSLDNVSSDAFLVWAGEGAGPLNDHGSSDFDLRHSFRASTGYEFGASRRALLRGWAIDSVFQARTGFPITVLSSEQYRGITFMNAFRPDLVASEPVWLADGSAPGGKRLNPAAFRSNSGRQGTLGRNTLAGFGMTQIDLSLRREFRWSDRKRIHLRVDAFNLLNHANFADPVRYLNSPIFGQSAAMLNMMLGTGSPGSGLAPILQTGGPRSVQIGLRFAF